MRPLALFIFIALLAFACEPYDRSRVGGGVRQQWESDPRMLLRIDSALIRDDSFHVHIAVANRDTIDRLFLKVRPQRGVRDPVLGVSVIGCGGIAELDWLDPEGRVAISKRSSIEVNDETGYLIERSATEAWTMSYPIAELDQNDPSCFDSVQVSMVLSNRQYADPPPNLFRGKLLSEWAAIRDED